MKKTYRTSRLQLRAPRSADSEAIYLAYGTDPAVSKYLAWSPHTSVYDAATFLLSVSKGWRTGEVYSWLVMHLETKCVLGMVELRIHQNQERANLGYVFAKSAWGHGFAHEAVSFLIGRAFAEMPWLGEVEAIVYEKNGRSLRLVRRLGMRKTRRRARLSLPNLGTRLRDAAVFSIRRAQYMEREQCCHSPTNLRQRQTR